MVTRMSTFVRKLFAGCLIAVFVGVLICTFIFSAFAIAGSLNGGGMASAAEHVVLLMAGIGGLLGPIALIELEVASFRGRAVDPHRVGFLRVAMILGLICVWQFFAFFGPYFLAPESNIVTHLIALGLLVCAVCAIVRLAFALHESLTHRHSRKE